VYTITKRGDFTCHGRPEELTGLIDAAGELDVPTVAVLGNHDYESDRHEDLIDLLAAVGIEVLDGTSLVVAGVGFAGVKGFGGGFGDGLVEAFGERPLKAFVEAATQELEKLDDALRVLPSAQKVVLMHYAPVMGTLVGEPERIWPFLGCSRFQDCIDRAGAAVAFHGHAHFGRERGETAGGVPVFNVAAPVLRENGLDVRLWSLSWRQASSAALAAWGTA
jgi:Icc-related predicted phosphoesterase